MGKRFDTLVFPGGKTRCFTLSYDDGVVQDRRLAEMVTKYGAKCTFNLNSALLGHEEYARIPGLPEVDISKVSPEEVASLYENHEVAGHGLYHSSLDSVGTPLAMYEISEDKRRLEALVKKPLKMFAYPFGFYNEEVISMLKLAGYQGARTVRPTYDFKIPEDFMVWDATCHHKDERLMELADKFVNGFGFGPRLFYVWGHAYEFDGAQNWDVMEKLLAFLQPHADKIWFATNGEIIDYVNAYRRLEYSVDGSVIYNPSALDVTIQTCFASTVTLKAGAYTAIEPTPL